jgi:hypothetical protein
MSGRFLFLLITLMATLVGLVIYRFEGRVGGKEGNMPAGQSTAEQSFQHADDPTDQSPSPGGPSAATVGQAYQSRFDASSDLRALVDQLRPESAGGDGTATRLIGKAYEECFIVALNGLASFQRDQEQRLKLETNEQARQGIERAFAQVGQRCKGFNGVALKLNQVEEMRNKAASQGDLAAMAEQFRHRMTAGDQGYGPQEQADLAKRVLASKDSEAVAAMAELMGDVAASRRGDLAPFPAGSASAEAAWQFAACNLGRNCGAQGSYLRTVCVSAGLGCRASSVQEMYRRELLPPAEFEKARQLAGQLVSYGASK